MSFKMLANCLYALGCIGCLHGSVAKAKTDDADTIRLNIQETERLFFEKNLQLIASHYNVQADSALIQQAKLWSNPTLNTDQNLYSHDKFFEHGTDANGQPLGQFYVQLQQLIQTAGKRGKQIKLAATNATITHWQFNDLLRNLKMQLRTDFYTVAQLESITELYVSEKRELEKLLVGMSEQLKAGNIARKDYLRVQALQISLEQDAVENDKKLSDAQAELKTMLQITGAKFIQPVLVDMKVPADITVTIPQLLDIAKQNNAAYQLQMLQVKYQQVNLSLQKALAVPDVTLGPNYDLNSNYAPHYVGLGISLPLPILNRNQGNIKAARLNVKKEETNMLLADQQLENDVYNAYKKLQFTLSISSDKQQSFYKDYNQLYNNIIESYKQRQISLIEFIDYFDAFKDTRQKQLQQELNIQLAKEELNYQAGTDIIN